MSDRTTLPTEHVAPPETFQQPEPLGPVEDAPSRSPAEEARTLVSLANAAALATVTDDGSPWASLVSYGARADGAPVLLVSTLAAHGRNLHRDPRASLMIADPDDSGELLDRGRVTLAGRAVIPEGDVADEAQAAHLAAMPSAAAYAGFGDFSLWVLEVETVRWVGGFGRMDSCSAADYAAARPDPVAAAAPGAVRHLNADHAEHLLLIGRTLAGYPDATEARCLRCDRLGLDLSLQTPRGKVWETRVAFEQPCTDRDGLRAAAVALVRRAEERRP